MAKTKLMLATVYTLKPLPQELRGTFQIPAYPFSKDGGEVNPKFLEWAKELGIVHYRDSVLNKGLIIDPDEDTDMEELSGFDCYKSQMRLLYKGMKIWEWTAGDEPRKLEKIRKKHGDIFAWDEWNNLLVIGKMTTQAVQIAR